MIDRRGEPFVVAMAPYLRPGLRAESRIAALAGMAAQDAVTALQQGGDSPRPVSVVIGLPEHRPGVAATLPSHVAASVRQALGDMFRVTNIRMLPHGNSSGLMAIEAGCRELRDGAATFVLAGGADSYVDVDALEWLDSVDRLHVPDNAWGFIPGEGAGFCLLCSAATAIKNSRPAWGRIVGVATAHEPNRIYTETICLGEGLTRAVHEVLATMPPGTKVDDTICDQNGEAYRADECGFMLARSSERFVSASSFVTPADCWGDVGAASGPLFVSLTMFGALKGYASGVNTLLWTSSDGGERSAMLLEVDTFDRRGLPWR
jgi:3-oxoacyl-[acyl-carrier-protein] synthase I